MPRMGMVCALWLRLILSGAVIAAVAVPRAMAAEEPRVFYEQATDRLTIEAEGASLKGLMARVTLLSGVEILMDPAVERTVSVSLKDVALKDGFKQIAHSLGLSYAMVYSMEEQKEPLLVQIKIVPKGKAGGGPGVAQPSLAPAAEPEQEAFVRALMPRTPKEGQKPPAVFDYAAKRWEARLEAMPPEKQNELLESAARRLEQKWAREAERERHMEERKKRREERKAQRQAMEEKLKETDPELYELRQQRKEEIRQRVTEEIKGSK